MNASVKKYDFSRLASVSLRELELERILHRYVISAERSQLIRALEKALQECVRGGCTLHSKGFRLEAAGQWMQRMGDSAVYAILSAVPGGPKALMVCEPVLALSIIDRILAGELTEIASPRSLSEIEFGVLSYVLARLCQVCHRFVDPTAMPIRLEKVHEDAHILESLVAGSEVVALAEVTIALPELSGVVQLVLPELFIREVMATQDVASPRAGQTSVQRLHELGDLSFRMRAAVGSATLTAKEVKQLEAGDIILLDQCHAFYDGQVLKGDIVFHPARHGVPTIVGSITDAGPPAKFAIKEIYREA